VGETDGIQTQICRVVCRSDGHGKLLSRASYRLMQNPVVPGEQQVFGWGVADSVENRKGPVLMHAGSDGTWYASATLFPETQNGILLATNSADDMGGDRAVKAARLRILPGLAPP
jgi:hypothetical protein